MISKNVSDQSKVLEFKSTNRGHKNSSVLRQCLPKERYNSSMMVMVCMLYFNYGLTEQHLMKLGWIVQHLNNVKTYLLAIILGRRSDPFGYQTL